MTDEALDMFGIKKEDLKDPDKFNRESLARKYRNFAKTYHPDRVDGNEAKFRELCANYAILLALLDRDKKEDAIDMVKAIALQLN